MGAPTVAVTCTAFDQNGNPVAGALYKARLDQTEIYGGFIVPEQVEGVADANGVCVLQLWPNALGVAGSTYTVTATNPDTGKRFIDKAVVSVPNSACNLHQIMQAQPYPLVDASQQALLDLQAAQAQIAAGVAEAAEQSALAVDASEASELAAAASLLHAQTAAQSRLEASQEAASAADDRAQTGLDRTQTTADRIQTTENRAQTEADRIQAGLDRAATAEDRAQTGLDRIAAGNSAESSQSSADDAETSERASTASAGLAVTAKADAQAAQEVARAQAVIAADKASEAVVSAQAAETKASESAMSAAASLAYRNTAIDRAFSASEAAEAAATQAGIAETEAAAARTSEDNALAYKNSANDSAVAAAGSAAAASDNAGESSANAASALDSKNAASTSAVEAAGSATQALAIYGNTAAQQAAQTLAASQSAQAVLSAAQANVAKEQALQAWAAATYPIETLAAISKTVHFGTVVKSIIYATDKDTDGGAWRRRCQDKSWYTEAICPGAWRQQLANLAAAWAVTGAAVGDFYQNTTDGKFYMIGGTVGAQTQTEVVRGNVREFPAQMLLCLEVGRLVAYDPTQVGCPMWMVFKSYANSGNSRNVMFQALQLGGNVAAINGKLFIAGYESSGGTWASGLSIVDFIAEKVYQSSANSNGLWPSGIANRNSLYACAVNGGYPLVSSYCNDIAVTVLDNAPIDPATGLAVPTIYVATNGGLSTIKDDGTVVNDLSTNGSVALNQRLAVTKDGRLMRNWNDAQRIGIAKVAAPTGVAHYNLYSTAAASGVVPQLPFAASPMAANALGSSIGAVLVKENPADRTKTMFAAITPTFNTGWQLGDSRMCALADTVAETITGSGELVVNGTFNDATGWTLSNCSISNGVLNVEGPTTCSVGATLIAGKSYSVTYTIVTATTPGSGISFRLGNVAGIVRNVAGTYTETVVSDGIPAIFIVSRGDRLFRGTLDNISVKLAEPDRSVKANGLVINGSLVKSPVAVGANLVGYSGFSATNYLEQPYNANLDFGTGDFCFLWWINPSATTYQTILHRSLSGSAGGLMVEVLNDGTVKVYASNTTAFTQILIAGGGTIPQGGYSLLSIYRLSGVLYISANGAPKASVAFTSDISYPNAVTRVGVRNDGTFPATSTSIDLLRISATAPSADQLAHAYRTELPLFQPGAQCTIAGTSAAVTAMAYDDVTDLLHVATAYGRSSFPGTGLLRVDSEVTTTGTITSLSAQGGTILTGGTSAKVYIPAKALRDELARKDEAKKALGKVPVFFESDAIAAQVAFPLPKGYTTKAVYSGGLLKRMGATKAYTVSFDGFVEVVTFAVAPGAATEISIMAVRSN